MRLPEYEQNLLYAQRQVMKNTASTPARLADLPPTSYREQLIQNSMKYNEQTTNLNQLTNIVHAGANIAKILLQATDFAIKGEINRQKSLGANFANQAIRDYNAQSIIESENVNTIDQSKANLDKIEQKYLEEAANQFGEDSVAYSTFRQIFSGYVTKRLDSTMMKKQAVYLNRLKESANNIITRGIVENDPDLISRGADMLLTSGYYTGDEVAAIVNSANSNRIKQAFVDKLGQIPASKLQEYLFDGKGDLVQYGVSQEEQEWLKNLSEKDKEDLYKSKQYVDKVKMANLLNWQNSNFAYYATRVHNPKEPLTIKELDAALTQRKIRLEQYDKLRNEIESRDTTVRRSVDEATVYEKSSELVNRYRTGQINYNDLVLGARSLVNKYQVKDPEKVVNTIIKNATAKDLYEDLLEKYDRANILSFKPSKKDAGDLEEFNSKRDEFLKKARAFIFRVRGGGINISQNEFEKGLQNIAESVFIDKFDNQDKLDYQTIRKHKDEYGLFGIIPKSDVANITEPEALMNMLIKGEGIGLSLDDTDDKVKNIYGNLFNKFTEIARNKGIVGKAVQSIDKDTLLPIYTVTTKDGIRQYMLDYKQTDKGGAVLNLVSKDEFFKRHPNLAFGEDYGQVVGDSDINGVDNRLVYMPDIESKEGTLAGLNYIPFTDFKFISTFGRGYAVSYLGDKDEIKSITREQFFNDIELRKKFYIYNVDRSRFIGNLPNLINNKDSLEVIWNMIEIYQRKNRNNE